ncbi:ADP-ribosyltransferase [Bacillus pseudomycoides]|nr:ADP-ribosyltransferase [Bacillus pseudomycoides]
MLKKKTVQFFENLNLNGGSKKPLSNLVEAHEWGSKHFDSWIESLTESERSAIRQYTGDDYRKINNYLRGIADALDGVESSVIDNIKSGLNKASVPYDIQVYRGTDLKSFENLMSRFFYFKKKSALILLSLLQWTKRFQCCHIFYIKSIFSKKVYMLPAQVVKYVLAIPH